MKKTLISTAVICVIGSGIAASAQAQSAGQVLGRVGVTHSAPDSSSSNLTLAPVGSQVTVGSSTQVSGGVTYMVTDNIAVDLPLVLPFKHTVTGVGAFIGGAGTVAETKALPITLLGQYRFGAANAQFRPYLGAGAVYAKFFKERSTALLSAATGGTPSNPTTVKFEDKFSVAVQAGISVNINPKWFVDANVIYSPLKTRANLSTGQTIDVKLNPTVLSFSVGYVIK